MGNTPISNLPYPEGTDRVMDGDNAIKALATALDGQTNGGPWTAMSPLGSGWTPQGGTYIPPQYRRVGDMVQVRGTATAASTGQPIFIWPANLRPALDLFFPTVANWAFGCLLLTKSNGYLSVNVGTAGPTALNFQYALS